MTANGTVDDERNVLATILGGHSSQQFQLVRSKTTIGHRFANTCDERQQTLGYIEQRIPELAAATLSDFATKNARQHNVDTVFALGPRFVAVTDEELRRLLASGGWPGLAKKHPGTKGIIHWSRVGFDRNANEALIYFGHRRAARSGSGWFRLFRRKPDGSWSQEHVVRAWIS